MRATGSCRPPSGTVVAMKVIIDSDACTGHGRCYTLVSDLFDSDDEGHSVLRVSSVMGAQVDMARTAVANCPERAIQLIED